MAEVDSDWTMKVYWMRGRHVSLERANKHYRPVVPRQRLAAVVRVIRKYPA